MIQNLDEISGLSKIHGENPGEKVDISELEEEMEHAVLTAILLLLLFHTKYDRIYFKIILKYFKKIKNIINISSNYFVFLFLMNF